jgi:hypothetical protein
MPPNPAPTEAPMIVFVCEGELVGDDKFSIEGDVDVVGTENGAPVKVAVVNGVIGPT